MSLQANDIDRWREQFPALSFTDDGERLHGAVRWAAPATPDQPATVFTARVEIVPGATFPFEPPKVRLLDPGGPLETTFHINADDTLCLWEDDWPVDEAPWLDARKLLDRITGWLQETAASWPGDDSCDLERYLSQERAGPQMVLYDATRLVTDEAVRTEGGPEVILVTDRVRRTGTIINGRRRNRRDRRLAWVADIGPVDRPIRTWDDVAPALGTHAAEVSRLIKMGVLDVVLLRYSRAGVDGALAVRTRPENSGIRITACESADTSTRTLTMRAGPARTALADVPIAIVGCGAIGSFAAELLFRAGARTLTLVDPELLRPGNVVRHFADLRHVGWPKPHAVRDCLSAIDPHVAAVTVVHDRVTTLAEATDLVLRHQILVDATGSGRASSLLATAVTRLDATAGHTVVSVCVQRDGHVLRVDRMPLRPGESHLPPLPALENTSRLRERGCGSPISPTPPGAAVAAAELALRVVIDEVTAEHALPATVADVRTPQDQPPFDVAGLIIGGHPRRAAS
ncbi:ThiF family adenylyltransferase [Amycolatopsis thermoflava]|uniref:ThiF family adenylyltransferase n=1 Tax=Amycolatopsis thermoflava TaxID=84480 RepID=UPI00364EDF0E